MGTDNLRLGIREVMRGNPVKGGAALVSIRRFDPSAVAAASLDFGLQETGLMFGDCSIES